jgi:hypothetical protein
VLTGDTKDMLHALYYLLLCFQIKEEFSWLHWKPPGFLTKALVMMFNAEAVRKQRIDCMQSSFLQVSSSV